LCSSTSLTEVSGTIPSALGDMISLTELCVDQLYFACTSSIPDYVAACRAISNCHLTGSIPAALGNLTALRFLCVRDPCSLNGP